MAPGSLLSGSRRLRPYHRIPPTAQYESLPLFLWRSANFGKYPTSVVEGNKTYTVTSATTLTITDCPCTQTKTYPATIITTTISYLTTVSSLISASVQPANSFTVLSRTHYDHLLGYNLPSHFSWYCDHPDRLVHYLPSHHWNHRSSSILAFLPSGNRHCSNYSDYHQRNQDTQVSFIDHDWPSPGFCWCGHEG
jgi:hypothetical protein